MKTCKKGYEVKILKSGAGYYLGTEDTNGCPNCRLTTMYARTPEEAVKLLLDRQFLCVENEFCNGGKGCFTDTKETAFTMWDKTVPVNIMCEDKLNSWCNKNCYECKVANIIEY